MWQGFWSLLICHPQNNQARQTSDLVDSVSEVPTQPATHFLHRWWGKPAGWETRESKGAISQQNRWTKIYTPWKTNIFAPKMDGWKTILSFWGPAYFQQLSELLVSGRVNHRFVFLQTDPHWQHSASFSAPGPDPKLGSLPPATKLCPIGFKNQPPKNGLTPKKLTDFGSQILSWWFFWIKSNGLFLGGLAILRNSPVKMIGIYAYIVDQWWTELMPGWVFDFGANPWFVRNPSLANLTIANQPNQAPKSRFNKVTNGWSHKRRRFFG